MDASAPIVESVRVMAANRGFAASACTWFCDTLRIMIGPRCAVTVPDHDRYRVHAQTAANDGDVPEPINEIDDYWSARYMSAMEGTWRTIGFNMAKKFPVLAPFPSTSLAVTRSNNTTGIRQLQPFPCSTGISSTCWVDFRGIMPNFV